MKPLFSIAIIAKDEESTLDRLMESLKDFRDRGGEICLLDTGSCDGTVNVATQYGCRVYEKDFTITICERDAETLNSRFVVNDEEPIVKTDGTLFNFADARNYISGQCSSNMICTLDCDEAYTKFDIDAINRLIQEGYEQFEYQFVYAHDQFGNPAIQFVQSKFFDRRKVRWSGIVHEVLEGPARIIKLDESVIKLEHFQQPGKEHRGKYLAGLAVDCAQNPGKDRQSHYLARELMYTGRYHSAIKEFRRHISMNGWFAERAQSMVHVGHCYINLEDPPKAASWFSHAFYTDPSRRVAFIELSHLYRQQDNKIACAAYAKAALEIPFVDYYANEMSHYGSVPHELLYWAYGWMGNIPAAREHILKALEYQPYNKVILDHTKYYFDYPDNGIEGWMEFSELQWLYETARNYENIVEVGSWKGRSTHALASGTTGYVTVVDTFKGSSDPLDKTHATEEDIHSIFMENTLALQSKIRVNRTSSLEAAYNFPDNSIMMLFLDAGHSTAEVLDDLRTWLPKMNSNGLICGHDYLPGVWDSVVEAVNQVFIKPDGIGGKSIWYVDLSKRPPKEIKWAKIAIEKERMDRLEEILFNEPVTLYQSLCARLKAQKPFIFIKRGDGELVCMNEGIGENCNGDIYYKDLGISLRRAYDNLRDWATIVEFYEQRNFNCLLHRTDNDPSTFWKLVADSKKPKVYIGPEFLKNAAFYLGARLISIPEKNVYNDFDSIFKYIPHYHDGIYIFSAGMAAKVMIAELWKILPGATFIDAGSAWDPTHKQSRTNQMTANQVHALYYAVPEEAEETRYERNMKLDPSTHPEKIWTMNRIIGNNVVDLGCGTNKTVQYATGIDIRKGVTDLTVDLNGKWGIPNHSVDTVISRHSMEHLIDPLTFLRKCMYILKKNGKLLIVLPDHEYINTMDPKYSAGQHLHVFTRETFKELIALFRDLYISNLQTVLERWSFGAEIHYDLPYVAILVPHLGREEGLKRLEQSIKDLNYPSNRIMVYILSGHETVPEKIQKAIMEIAETDIFCYAANDMEFTRDALIRAVECTNEYGLVAFNSGKLLPDEGNICEHFIITRELVGKLNGVVFDTRLKHCGVDNLLWARAKKLGQAYRTENAKVLHHHFSHLGGQMDEVYEKGWKHVEEDRKLLRELLTQI